MTEKVKDIWAKQIEKSLKDGLTIEDLHHQYTPTISMEPHVVAGDLTDFHNEIVNFPSWKTVASIHSGTPIQKNKLILQALMEGANGLDIWVEHDDELDEILQGVMIEYLSLRLVTPDTSLNQLVLTQKLENTRVVDGIHRLESIIHAGNRIEEMAKAIRESSADGHDFRFVLSRSFLFEIACLRAFRIILERNHVDYKILASYDIEGKIDIGDYNLVEQTYKVLSAVLGGADEIITSYTGDEASRLALNIHNILDLESGMKMVKDPTSGAYYIEKLTAEVIRQVDLELTSQI